MIVMIAAAILGALLGLTVRPWLLAPVIAAAIGGAVQGGMMFAVRQLGDAPEHVKLVATLTDLAGSSVQALWPTLAAGAVAALLAALLAGMAESQEKSNQFWLPDDGPGRARGKDGRLRRLPGMVEERAIHARAESRIDTILGL